MFQEGTAAPDRHRGIPDAVDRLPVLEPAAVAGKASPVPSQLPVCPQTRVVLLSAYVGGRGGAVLASGILWRSGGPGSVCKQTALFFKCTRVSHLESFDMQMITDF